MGPHRAAAISAELDRGARPRGLALLGWAGGLRDDLAIGDIVIRTGRSRLAAAM